MSYSSRTYSRVDRGWRSGSESTQSPIDRLRELERIRLEKQAAMLAKRDSEPIVIPRYESHITTIRASTDESENKENRNNSSAENRKNSIENIQERNAKRDVPSVSQKEEGSKEDEDVTVVTEVIELPIMQEVKVNTSASSSKIETSLETDVVFSDQGAKSHVEKIELVKVNEKSENLDTKFKPETQKLEHQETKLESRTQESENIDTSAKSETKTPEKKTSLSSVDSVSASVIEPVRTLATTYVSGPLSPTSTEKTKISVVRKIQLDSLPSVKMSTHEHPSVSQVPSQTKTETSIIQDTCSNSEVKDASDSNLVNLSNEEIQPAKVESKSSENAGVMQKLSENQRQESREKETCVNDAKEETNEQSKSIKSSLMVELENKGSKEIDKQMSRGTTEEGATIQNKHESEKLDSASSKKDESSFKTRESAHSESSKSADISIGSVDIKRKEFSETKQSSIEDNPASASNGQLNLRTTSSAISSRRSLLKRTPSITRRRKLHADTEITDNKQTKVVSLPQGSIDAEKDPSETEHSDTAAVSAQEQSEATKQPSPETATLSEESKSEPTVTSPEYVDSFALKKALEVSAKIDEKFSSVIEDKESHLARIQELQRQREERKKALEEAQQEDLSHLTSRERYFRNQSVGRIQRPVRQQSLPEQIRASRLSRRNSDFQTSRAESPGKSNEAESPPLARRSRLQHRSIDRLRRRTIDTVPDLGTNTSRETSIEKTKPKPVLNFESLGEAFGKPDQERLSRIEELGRVRRHNKEILERRDSAPLIGGDIESSSSRLELPSSLIVHRGSTDNVAKYPIHEHLELNLAAPRFTRTETENIVTRPRDFLRSSSFDHPTQPFSALNRSSLTSSFSESRLFPLDGGRLSQSSILSMSTETDNSQLQQSTNQQQSVINEESDDTPIYMEGTPQGTPVVDHEGRTHWVAPTSPKLSTYLSVLNNLDNPNQYTRPAFQAMYIPPIRKRTWNISDSLLDATNQDHFLADCFLKKYTLKERCKMICKKIYGNSKPKKNERGNPDGASHETDSSKSKPESKS